MESCFVGNLNWWLYEVLGPHLSAHPSPDSPQGMLYIEIEVCVNKNDVFQGSIIYNYII